ncbi:MAG: PEP-CTERM sorting domain-containing protein [Gammaproteobacteria bacterium]|nr:PEP-CTERM sorting domain-containing protein [Gammaproteobacteria bacterium]
MARFFVFMALLFSASASAAPIYEMTNGILTRITDVEVNGMFYDVSFQNGSFNSIYGSADNLTFTTGAGAVAASNVLLSLMGENVVGSDGLTYDFEHGNWLVNGCANYIYCDMMTTYNAVTDALGNGRAYHVYARNFNDLYASPGADSDFVMYGGLPSTYVTNRWPWYTYAIWTKSTLVPEASSLLLLGVGLLGMSFARRR